jgi:HSP20 family protein
MEILGSDIFEQMRRLQQELGQLAGQSRTAPAPAEDEFWRPPVDICEQDDSLLLIVDLPGVRKEDIDLQVDGDTLTLQGQRAAAAETVRLLRRERPAGHFRRAFRITIPISPSGVTASYRDGVLKINLPKVSASEPVRIQVEVE